TGGLGPGSGTAGAEVCGGRRSVSKRAFGRGRRRMTPRRERAQALVFLTAMLPLFLAVTGLALDGGHLFAERANLQAVADASARAGAVRLDTARMYAEGTGAVFLSPAEAAAAARDYASYHGLASDEIDTAADDQAVSVQLHSDV